VTNHSPSALPNLSITVSPSGLLTLFSTDESLAEPTFTLTLTVTVEIHGCLPDGAHGLMDLQVSPAFHLISNTAPYFIENIPIYVIEAGKRSIFDLPAIKDGEGDSVICQIIKDE